MANPYFKFKKFTVWHDKCAMKVGTDGVLLGAWTQVRNASTALDVGTGTGLIALMLAQRNSNIAITAVDVDSDAAWQAKENISNSPFVERIEVKHASFQNFLIDKKKAYDVIVSNPPYFQDSLLSPLAKRNVARHTISFSLPEMLRLSKQAVKPDGRVSLILPYNEKEALETIANDLEWEIIRQTTVFPTANSLPKRLLTELALLPRGNKIEDMLIIENQRHQYSDEFVELVKDFYLHL